MDPSIQGTSQHRRLLQPLSDAIVAGDLKKALEFLNSCPPNARNHLKAHTINELPVLHCFARHRFSSADDTNLLQKILTCYIDNGYDINQKTDLFPAQKRTPLGFSALLAAVERSNAFYVRFLIQFGADPNTRDTCGFGPCHWAILVGSLQCLEALIEGGAILRSTKEEMGGEYVHPILHTAVDEGRTQIVFYLLSKSGVDINEEAVYRGVLSEKSFTNFPSRYNCTMSGSENGDTCESAVETVDIGFTPLGRAVRMRKIPIIEVLLKHKAKLSGFNELHFCIVEGDTEVACLLMKYFTDEELANDKIDGNWALHYLHKKAFQDELLIEKTKELICEYIDAGWDVNSISSDISREVAVPVCQLIDRLRVSGCNLLHLACLYGSYKIIECLLDEGVDVNERTSHRGNCNAQLLPLQILILLGCWESAELLIKNAELGAIGEFSHRRFSYIGREYAPEFLPRDSVENETINSESGDYLNTSRFNSLELLLKLGYPDGLALLELMLKKATVGINEFFMALEGGNPIFARKVFNLFIKPEMEADWKLICFPQSQLPLWQSIPSLSYLLMNAAKSTYIRDESDVLVLASLMESFVSHGYNCNVLGRTFSGCFVEHIIFLALQIDFKNRTTVLLKTLLQFDHVSLNVVNEIGMNPAKYVIDLWNKECLSDQNTKYCWQTNHEKNYCSKTVELLLNSGINVCNTKIGEHHVYHFGYNKIVKLLLQAGARIPCNIFEAGVCHPGCGSTIQFQQEIQDLRKWIEEANDKLKVNLQHLSRVGTRKLLQKVGDLEILDVLPKLVKDAVLCK